MKHVLNTKPNAAALNSGIQFEPHPDGGMISVEPVDDDTAKRFASIPGYKIVEDKGEQKAAKKPAADKETAEQKAAREAEAAAKKTEKGAAKKPEADPQQPPPGKEPVPKGK